MVLSKLLINNESNSLFPCFVLCGATVKILTDFLACRLGFCLLEVQQSSCLDAEHTFQKGQALSHHQHYVINKGME